MAFGVSESSIKRWADEGQMAAFRTNGGHRRIPIGEALRFARGTRTRIVRPEILGLPAEAAIDTNLSSGIDSTQQLLDAFMAGNVGEVVGLIVAWYLLGQSIAGICDGPIRRAMEQVGSLWIQQKERGVFIEHCATDMCIRALYRLRFLLPPTPREVVAVGGAAPGDGHLLASLALSVVLESEGYRAVNLGANSPLESLSEAAELHSPRLVWISMSHAPCVRPLAGRLNSFASTLRDRGVRTAIGGCAAGELRPQLDRDVFLGSNFSELIAFLKGLSSLEPEHRETKA